MKKINIVLDKNKKYIVACSFGPDSMALLDALLKQQYSVAVAHVNYRKRDVSIDEQRNLTKYCDDRHIRIHVLDLLGVKHHGNFQEWAREQRYNFFKKVLEEEKADAVLVAHQQDDVIETFLMQKKRGNFVKFAGISRENEICGVKVIRPLLDYSKKYLLNYDIENSVPYSIDESNLTDHYTRNIFRHHVVEKMSESEREKILKEIDNLNRQDCDVKKCSTKMEFLSLSYEQIIILLNIYMEKTGEHRDLSHKYIEEIKKAISKKTNISFSITKSFSLEFDYENVYFVNEKKIVKYRNEFINTFRNEFIDIDFSNGTLDRKIDLKNKNLFIKNLDKNDKIIIKDYYTKVNRLFIDWKMPLFLRKVWPGIYDKNGTLLYIPRYRSEFKDNHTSKFVINTKYFEEF